MNNGRELKSREGTTQGDNLAMSFYALSTSVMINSLHFSLSSEAVPQVKQVWLADDGTGAGKVSALKSWWDLLLVEGGKIGFHVNAGKSWLIAKNDAVFNEASELFNGTSINITLDGQRHLGAVLGSNQFRSQYTTDLVSTWCREMERLSELAESQP